jgi:DNA-binding transcriptional ArsR family regulator
MVVRLLTETEADRVFQALSDSTRRDIVKRVMESEQSVSELARHYRLTFAAVQKHVAVLERAGLVAKERRGREQIVSSNVETIREASRLLLAFEDLWQRRSTRMEEILTDTE